MNHSLKFIHFILIAALFLFGCQEEAPLEEIIRPVKALSQIAENLPEIK